MPLLTILSGLAILAINKRSSADPVRQMLDTIVGGGAGNQFFTDFHNIRRGLAQWLHGIRPDQNMAIERAVLRSALHADMFCLIEAAGEPLELPPNRAERWLQILRDRLPDKLKHLGELPGGFFYEAGVGQLRLARKIALERLRRVEQQSAPSPLDADKLLGSEDANYAAQAASEALGALENSEADGHLLGRLPEKARDLFLANWFGYLCGSFHYEVRSRQEVANIYLTTSVAELKEGMAGVRDGVTEVREGVKLLLGRLQPWQPPSTYTLPDLGYFIGREAELEEAVARWLGPAHQPLLIQGESGIGKSTLALAILHHPEVQERFGARRYQIRCDPLESAAHLEAEMGRRWFGLEPGDRIAEQVLARLKEGPAALVVDNLESMLRKDDAAGCEEWLRSLLGLKTVWLIATVLGHERPGGIRWSKPAEPQRLSLEAARDLFCVIAPEEHRRDPRLDRLLADQQGVPRAIELLAHQVGGEPDLALLAARWESSGTLVLQRLGGKGRETSLARSYEFAMEGVDEGALRLLRVLARLPAGVCQEDVPSITQTVGETTPLDAAAALERTTLAYFETSRLHLLANLRDYLRRKHPANTEEAEPPRGFFLHMALEGQKAGTAGGREAVALLSENLPNVAWAIGASLNAGNPAAIPAAIALGRFSRFSGLGDATLLIRAGDLAARTGDLLSQANCIFGLGDIALRRSDHEQARQRYEDALPLYRQVASVLGEASCIRGLGDIARERSDHEQSRQQYENALQLYRQMGSVLGEASCILGLGDIALERSDTKEARHRHEEALPLYRQAGSVLGEANCIFGLGDIALRRSDHEQARQRYEDALPLYRQVGSVLGEANCVRGLGDIALERSDTKAARQRYEEALPLYRQLGAVLGEANCIQRLGDIALECSDHKEARQLYEEALARYERVPEPSSIGGIYRRLARIDLPETDRNRHVQAAREAWLQIERPDLVKELDDEFGPAQALAGS